MKVLNPANPAYAIHATNVANIINSCKNRETAVQAVDLYIEVVSGTSTDPRTVSSHLKQTA